VTTKQRRRAQLCAPLPCPECKQRRAAEKAAGQASSDANRASTTDCLAPPRCRLSLRRRSFPILPIQSVPFHDSFLTIFRSLYVTVCSYTRRNHASGRVRSCIFSPSKQVMCWMKRQRGECSGFWLCHFHVHARHLHHMNPSFYYSIAGKLKHNVKYKSPFCAMFSAKCDNSFPSQFLNSQVLSFPAFSSHIVD
jgi:hypothetical protein